MAAPAAALTILVNANTASASSGLARINAQLHATDTQSHKASGAVAGFVKNLSLIGAAGTAVGLGLAVKASADFEKQLDSLGAVSNATGKEMARFREQALKASTDTKFSAIEAAQAQTELAKGGLSVAQIMGGGLKSSLALAAAGEMELAEAASTTVNAMKLFELRGKDSMRVADGLATAANRTTADVSDFAMALSQGGSAAKAAGLSFTETVAALEALAEIGVKNSDAGTSLKTALIQLANPTKEAAGLMRELGLDFFKANGEMKSLVAISGMLEEKLGGLTREQRLQAATTLVGTDGMRALLALYEAGPDKISKFQKELQKQGTAADVAAKKTDNLAGDARKALNTLQTLGIRVGEKLTPALRDAAQAFTEFIKQMMEGKGAGGALVTVVKTVIGTIGALAEAVADAAKWLGEHKTVLYATAAAAGVLFAAYAGFTVFFLVKAAVLTLAAAMVTLNATLLSNPIVLVVAALAALAAAFVVAYRDSETFRDIVDAAWKVVKAAAGALWDVIKVVFPAIGDVIKTVWNVVKTITLTVWGAIRDFLEPLWRALKAAAMVYFTAYRTIVTTAWNAIRTVTQTVWNGIKGFLEGAWDTIKIVAGAAWDAIKTVIVNPIREAMGAIRNAINNVIDWLGERWEDIKKAADKLAKPFITAFEKMKGVVQDVLDVLGKIVGVVEDIIDFIGKIKIPKIDLPDLNPLGGAGNGTTVGPTPSKPAGVDAFNMLAASFGNIVTSGYRPGDPGWHGQNRARDYAGGNMLGFARAMLRYAPYLLELIFTPLGIGVKNGQVVPIGFFGPDVMADHYDHVHVAMEKGGYVRQGGWALVGEKGPELAHLPSGARVYSNTDSQQMLGTPVVHVSFANGMEWLRQFVKVEIDADGRRSGRIGARGLPGGGGGLTRG